MAEDRQQPKIIIDNDWKSQAQAEKERLAAAEREKAAKEKEKARASTTPGMLGAGAAAGAPGAEDELGEGGGEPLEANFKALLGTLITNALMYMGAFPDPQTGRAVVAPEYAKFHIDLIAVLQEKTKNNLSKEEQEQVDQSLNELRMQFVELMKAVTAMAMKQEAQRGGMGGMGMPGGGGSALGDMDPAKAAQRLRGM